MPRLPSSHSLWTLEASRTDIAAAETHAKVVRDPLPRPPPHPPSSKKMEKKKREKKGENLESGAALPILIRRPWAISSPRAGRRNVSLCGEKEQGDVTLFRQVTDTRTARYRAVPSKIDHRRPIEEEIDRRRSIEEEKGKKKRKRKKKRRGEERIPRPPAVAARCRRQRVACGRGRSRFFSRARRRSVSPVHTAWYGSCTGTDNMSVYWYGLHKLLWRSQGATIVDQHVCITRWGSYDEDCSFWNRPSYEDNTQFTVCIFLLIINI
ncbi:hypothetical protein BHE74_00023142 [Ensete ventricosum]|nr:hypothetical protein BHE74_00023142 [Ensete ventricosum]